MPSGSQFRRLVSGASRGAVAGALRAILAAAEIPYAAAVGFRNRRYDRGRWPIARASVPVVSVGNLTLGGTGKTPLVEWIARWLVARGLRVAIVSRGYGGRGGANDEARELAERLPGVPHVQQADRRVGAARAVSEHGAQAIVLDDGFQHRRLARDLDIVVIDATEPFGFERVFPRGTLREPLAGLARAQVVVLSRADLISDAERSAIRQRVAMLAPAADWVVAQHVPSGVQTAAGEELPLESLAWRRVAAFCGIGNPAAFRRTLEKCGLAIAGFREFDDHHAYLPADLEALRRWAAKLGAEALVATHKDRVKIDTALLGEMPLWTLSIRLEIVEGEAALERRLESLLPRQQAS